MAERSKYDTNPLDPDVAHRADEQMEEATRALGQTDPLRSGTGQVTRGPVPQTGPANQQTNAYMAPPSYPSMFVPPVYQPPATHGAQQYPLTLGPPSSRPVSRLNLPENLTMIMPYCPFFIGIVASIIELLIVPRNELRVRFHAAQGLTLQIAFVAISLFFTVIRLLTGSGFGGSLFRLAAFVFLIISMVRVWKGRSHHIAPLDEGTKWLNEHVEWK